MMKTVKTGGARLAVEDVGTGQPILLVHGFPLNHEMWSAQIDDLATDYRVIAPDLRGFGASEATPGTVSMDQFADDLVGILNALELKEPVTLAGLSMGGYVAFSFWKRHADRLGALILLDTKSAADAPDTAEGRRQSAQAVRDGDMENLISGLMGKVLAPATAVAQPAVAERVHAIMASSDPVGVSAALLGMAERQDWTSSLESIRLPTLVVVGSDDAISPPAEMQQIADAIPGAEFVEIANAGHLSPMENPKAVNAALRAFMVRVA